MHYEEGAANDMCMIPPDEKITAATEKMTAERKSEEATASLNKSDEMTEGNRLQCTMFRYRIHGPGVFLCHRASE